MSLAKTARSLTPDSDGIWRSHRTATVSYPHGGNDECYQLEDRSYWFQHRNDCIVSLVRRFRPGGAFLDVGGGNGYVTRRLLDEHFDSSLLEPGPAGAWNGRMRRAIPEVMCSTLEDAGFPPASIDAIGCFDVVEHIADDREFLSRVHDLLKPGGLFFATVPAHDWLWSTSDVVAGHYRRYDRRAIAGVLHDSRLSLLFFTYLFGVLTWPVLMLRALPFRLGLSKEEGVLTSETEHGTQEGPLVGVIRRRLAKEAGRIARGESLRFGTSCLFVAQRPEASGDRVSRTS